MSFPRHEQSIVGGVMPVRNGWPSAQTLTASMSQFFTLLLFVLDLADELDETADLRIGKLAFICRHLA